MQWTWLKDGLPPEKRSYVLCGPQGGLFMGVPTPEITTNRETGAMRGSAWVIEQGGGVRPYVAWMLVEPPNEFLKDVPTPGDNPQ